MQIQQLICKKKPSLLWCLWRMTENAFLEISIQCLVTLDTWNVENVGRVFLKLWKMSHQKKVRVHLIFLLQCPNSYSTLVVSIIQRHYCQPLVSKISTKMLSLHWMLFLVQIPFVTYFITHQTWNNYPVKTFSLRTHFLWKAFFSIPNTPRVTFPIEYLASIH